MSLSQLSRLSHASLTIIETPWTIEGDPEELWRWVGREEARIPRLAPSLSAQPTQNHKADQ